LYTKNLTLQVVDFIGVGLGRLVGFEPSGLLILSQVTDSRLHPKHSRNPKTAFLYKSTNGDQKTGGDPTHYFPEVSHV
jgi:hypothetical protein